MVYILCLETATEVCSVALHKDGQLLSLSESSEPFMHTSQITKMVEQCLSESNIAMSKLSAVAVSSGPGSYTGLRVGLAVAKGICYSLQIPLIAIDSLEALARGAITQLRDRDLIISSIDARRQEVYASVYSDAFEPIINNQAVILDQFDFSDLVKNSHRILLTGNGSQKFINYLPNGISVLVLKKSSAKYMVDISQQYFLNENFVELAYFSPNYIKPPNITKTRKKLL